MSKFKKTVGFLDFFIPGAKLAFTKLKQAFFKAPILHHFNLERYIRIETDVLGYIISGVLNQLTSNDLGQWHSVTFFSRKIILAEIRYETHNDELLAIIETFKTWRHYLEGFEYEVFMLINLNNLRQFMNKKSLSFRKVYWV